MSRSRSEMYIGRGCLCVYMSVPRRIATLLHGHGCKLGNGIGCPLVVHYLADLQSVHGFRCYDNSAEREMSASACSCYMPGRRYVVDLLYNKLYNKIHNKSSLVLGWVTVFGRANHLGVSPSHLSQLSLLSYTGREMSTGQMR